MLLRPLLLSKALDQLADLALESLDLLLGAHVNERLLPLALFLWLLVLVLQNAGEARLEKGRLMQVLVRLVSR